VDLHAATRIGPPADDVTVVELDGCASLYSPATANVVSLNETATQVWRRCDGSRALAGIVDDLAAQYGVSADAIAAEVEAVVTGLVEQGLLQQPAPGRPPG
jgi:Coenzyme PQQ synthesis protein D (PqqD)